jgi:isoquinoline 1-oxidoreductase beta subunit
MNEALGAAGGQVTAWLAVGADESITLTIGASEMGQGSFTGLAQVLAEELIVDFARVKTLQGGPSLINPVPVGAAINTVGSSVMRGNFWKMRDAGAIARETLVQAAMNLRADQTRTNYTVVNGVVKHIPTGITMTYSSLAYAASLLKRPTSARSSPTVNSKSSARPSRARTSPPK